MHFITVVAACMYVWTMQLNNKRVKIAILTLAAALISYFCISVYFIIVTLVVVAFDNLHSTEMK